MLGYDVNICKLKVQPTSELLLQIRAESFKGGVESIYKTLRGDSVGHIPHIFHIEFPIYAPMLPSTASAASKEAFNKKSILDKDDNEQVIYSGGYPTIFTARGKKLISEFAKENPDRLTAIDPQDLYLVTVWDLS